MSRFSNRIIKQINKIKDHLTTESEEFISILKSLDPSIIENSQSSVTIASVFQERLEEACEELDNIMKNITKYHYSYKFNDKAIEQLNCIKDEITNIGDRFFTDLKNLNPSELDNSQLVINLSLDFEDQLIKDANNNINNIIHNIENHHSHSIFTQINESIEIIGEIISYNH